MSNQEDSIELKQQSASSVRVISNLDTDSPQPMNSNSKQNQPPLNHLKIIFVLCLILLVLLTLPNKQTDKKITSKLPKEGHAQLDKTYRGITTNWNTINKRESIQMQQRHNHPKEGEHAHPIRKMQQPTIGVPKANSFFNYTRVFMSKSEQFEKALDKIIKPYNDTDCEQAIFGAANDESYILCKNLMEHSTAIINMGLQNADSFGCQISRQYPINNYLYDCERQFAAWMCWANDRMIYERKCFGERVENIEGWQYTTIGEELKTKDLADKPIIMKIDLNGAQWAVLRYESPQILNNIDQLVIEFHLPENEEDKYIYWGDLDIVRTINQHFVSVNMHMNNLYPVKRNMKRRVFPALAFEVTFVNRKLITINEETRSYVEKVRNKINGPGEPDIQMRD